MNFFDILLAKKEAGSGDAVLKQKTVTQNGTYNASSDSADGYSKVTVSVPASAVDTGTKSITANGTNQDVVGYAAVDVNVPNTYAAGDEGKVVSGGALVAQTARSSNITENGTYDTTTNNSVTVNVSGGTSITNGYVVTEFTSDNFIKAVEYYGSVLPLYAFGNARITTDLFAFKKLATIDFKASSIYLNRGAFTASGITELSTSAIKGLDPNGNYPYNSNQIVTELFRACTALVTLSLPEFNGRFSMYEAEGCTSLKTVYLPKVTKYASYGTYNRGCFLNNTALETVQMGSVGYGVTDIDANPFGNCTQSGLTITCYTTGSYVDTALANIRNGATNATIIIKASEALTYGGNSYAAGDNIVTSTP